MKHVFIIFLTSWFVFLHAAQAAPRTCRLVYPERPQEAPKTAYLFDGNKSHSVALPSMNFSEVIELPDGEITIAMTASEISDPELLSPKTPFLKIPETVRDFYIIILPDPNNEILPIKLNLVDTGGEKLKPGETLWYNFTEHRILAKLGSENMMVSPRGRTISRRPIPESGYYEARLAYQADGNGLVAPITEQSWWHDANSKHLGFIVNTGGKLPKIYFYRDFRDP
jgi:hypothetical protein